MSIAAVLVSMGFYRPTIVKKEVKHVNAQKRKDKKVS